MTQVAQPMSRINAVGKNVVQISPWVLSIDAIKRLSLLIDNARGVAVLTVNEDRATGAFDACLVESIPFVLAFRQQIIDRMEHAA